MNWTRLPTCTAPDCQRPAEFQARELGRWCYFLCCEHAREFAENHYYPLPSPKTTRDSPPPLPRPAWWRRILGALT